MSAIVELRKEHCGLAVGRITSMTERAAKQLEQSGVVKILQTNASAKAQIMAERSVHPDATKPEPDTDPDKEPDGSTSHSFDSMKKAKDKPNRDKAVKSETTTRKAPTNVTTSEG